MFQQDYVRMILSINFRLFVWVFSLTGCASVPTAHDAGLASYYADFFHGKLTASGAPYDSTLLTAAHRDLPFGQKVRVTNLTNNRTVDVIINDRGPFVKQRIIDLSKSAARELEMLQDGVVKVEIALID